MTNSDMALREACVLAEEILYNKMLAEFETHPSIMIPERQRERIHKLIYSKDPTPNVNTQKKTSSKKIKTALLIAAIFIVLFAVTATAFGPFKDFFVKIYNDCTEIVFNTTNKNDYLFADYTYIPEGYLKVKDIQIKAAKSQSLLYINGKSRINISTQSNRHSSTFIDTENAETGEISVNKTTGYYSITETSIILVWSTGKYTHVICADKCDIINLELLVKIAQSRQPIK